MDNPLGQSHTPASGNRLDSWKEIAAYLKRDIRTAQRWEKHEGLPVRRHLHADRGTAYAYAAEIDQWLQNRSRQGNSPSAGNGASSVVDSREPVHRSPTSASAWVRVGIAMAVACAAGATGTWGVWRNRPAPTLLSSLSIVFPPSDRFHDWGPDITLSPDGSTVVYAGLDGRLNVRRIDQLSSRTLDGTDGSWAPFFSPDGRWIGFNQRGRLKKISVSGGAPVPLGVSVGFMGTADWGLDDNIGYAEVTPRGTHGLYRTPANGGVPQLVADLDKSADAAYWLTPQSIARGNVVLATLAQLATSGPRFDLVA